MGFRDFLVKVTLSEVKPPDVFHFEDLVVAKARAEVIGLDRLEYPAQISTPTIQQASIADSDELLRSSADVIGDAFDDGFIPSIPDIAANALDDGLFISEAETVDTGDSLPSSVEVISDALAEGFITSIPDIAATLDDGLFFHSNADVVGDAFDDGFITSVPGTAASIDDGLFFHSSADVICDAFDDGFIPSIPDIAANALDDGLFFPDVEIVDVDDSLLLFPPEVVEGFALLARPRVEGKDYREQEQVLRTGTRQPNTGRRNRYGHRVPKVPVVDVFEQLRYILQPPILPPDGKPVIFPNGNKPYPYQIAGVNWLVQHEQALLADQMGLGKTIQAIVAIRVLFRKGELENALVVCPASMTNVWEREIKSWAPELRPLRIQGQQWLRADAWQSHAEIYIVSYETLRNDIDRLPPEKFGLYVLDEAQKIKNPSTKAHRAVAQLTPKHRWALTGTPIENRVDDVVAIFDVLIPDLFEKEYSHPTYIVRLKIEPYLLRRTIEQVKLDLPELTHQEHWLDLLPRQRAAYDSTERHEVNTIKRMGQEATRIHILALITQLKQICNYDDSSGQSCKLNFIIDELEDLSEDNDKALVFSQYPVKTLEKIEPKLSRFAPLTYSGSLSSKQRDDVIAKFQDTDDNAVLLMSVRAGGMGITLTRANHVFHFDHWWNPAIVDQASARVHRIGQKKPVFIHSLYAVDTIEQRIFDLLQQKREVFRAVFGQNAEASDEDLTRMSDEDLFGLFGLDVPGKPKTGAQADSVNGNASKPFADMSPREFEEAVRDMFEGLGYRLSLTKQSGDGGIDLDGHRLGLGGGRVVVQCKRYSGAVSVAQVRDLFGVVSSDSNIEAGFLVTTGHFSSQTRDFAKDKRITLIDGLELQARFRQVTSSVGAF